MIENVKGFPFKLENLNKLVINVRFTQSYGNGGYKLGMNIFTNNKDTPDADWGIPEKREWDFFFIFKQLDGLQHTGIPTKSLSDITVGGRDFERLYYDYQPRVGLLDHIDGYTDHPHIRRRVIIKDGKALFNPRLNVREQFKDFEEEGFFDFDNLAIANIAFGVEITKGYGCISFRSLRISHDF